MKTPKTPATPRCIYIKSILRSPKMIAKLLSVYADTHALADDETIEQYITRCAEQDFDDDGDTCIFYELYDELTAAMPVNTNECEPPEEPTVWTNHYQCPCGEEWEDTHDCCCNDRCPACNKEIEPYISDDGSVSPEAIEDAHKHVLTQLGWFVAQN